MAGDIAERSQEDIEELLRQAQMASGLVPETTAAERRLPLPEPDDASAPTWRLPRRRIGRAALQRWRRPTAAPRQIAGCRRRRRRSVPAGPGRAGDRLGRSAG